MHDAITKLFNDFDGGTISRRQLLQALGVAAVGAPLSAALGQGRCRKTLNAPSCVTAPIDPVFAPTGWKTVMLDRLTISVPDYRKEAAFYTALMGWTLRSDDGKQAVMDLGDWGTVVLKQGPPAPPADTTGRGAGGGRGGAAGRAPSNAVVQSFCWGIENWDAKKVEAELRKRGLDPIADNDGKDFQSFHVKDPDGFDLQISNGNKGNRRRTPANATLAEAAPFESTGWKTVWLDHISFGVTNYKKSASFYSNLLGWTPTYDEGSQHELMIGDVGDIIIRGGNPLDPNFNNGGGRGGAAGAPAAARRTGIDHISFGIDPWDTDGVKAELEKRGLRAQIDTSTDDEIHVAAYKSYHTFTPNGFNLQISWTHRDNRQALNYAVYPRVAGQHRPPDR